jgi:hypothetical protein
VTNAEQRWAWLDVPLLVACWLLGYWAPWSGTGTAWLALAEWGAVHAYTGLERASTIVTVIVTGVAVLGAILRLMFATGTGRRIVTGQLGLFAVCAPLCLVMPSGGALFFLAAAAAVSIAGCWKAGPEQSLRQPLAERLLRESFAVLAAGCFVALSWQYNAQWLVRGLLIAAGVALMTRATLPARSSAGS